MNGADRTRRVDDIGCGCGTAVAAANARHLQILLAYIATPNAAAVGRALRTNERHVRRVVDDHRGRVDELRASQDQERREAVRSRQMQVEAWASVGLTDALYAIDEAARSDNATLALRANKLKIDLALRHPTGLPLGVATALDHELDEAHRAIERDIADVVDGWGGDDAA
jgi:hypothetical protein